MCSGLQVQPDVCKNCCSDLALSVSVVQAQCIHGTDDGSQGLDGVAVNDRLVLLDIISGEAVLMDDPGHTNTHNVGQSASFYYCGSDLCTQPEITDLLNMFSCSTLELKI